MKRQTYGFSVVELIVIIVVIGILATIGILSYNGVQNNAHDNAVQSDLNNIASKLEAYRTQQSNISQQFPSNGAQLISIGFSVNKDSYDTSLAVNLAYCTNATRQEFALAAASRSGNIYLMTEDGFRSHALTKANFTTGLCGTLGLTAVAYGYSSGAWQI